MNDGLICSNGKAIKKLANLEHTEIIRSNEVYSNTGIIDLPKMWSPYYKITKSLVFGFRV